MSAVLIDTQCRHVDVIPVKVDVTNRGIVYNYFMMHVCGKVKTTARVAVDTRCTIARPEVGGNSTSHCPGYRGQFF